MVPRRFHTKSRFGCTVCRRRRVKCDERQPTCSRCEKIRSECTYSHDQPTSIPSPKQSPSQLVEDHSTSQLQSGFDLLDLSLMHHYAINTSQHLFIGQKQAQVWQTYMPLLGSTKSVVMHGILAITALHRAREDSNHRGLYRTRALHHHGTGLPLFKAMVASASPETAETIVAYAILLGIWIYASPDVTGEQLCLDDILNTLEVVRTGRSVFLIYQDIIATTPIGLFLTSPCREPMLANQVASAHDAMETLRAQVDNPIEKATVDHLRTLVDQHTAGANCGRSAAGWIASVGEDYWARLRSHHPHALLVFAYSCILVSASEHECWWLAGWFKRILHACDGALSLTDKETIRWDSHKQTMQTLGAELAKTGGTEIMIPH